MIKPLNLTKQEAECLRRLCSAKLVDNIRPLTHECKPFIEHLAEKLEAMNFPEKKLSHDTPKQKLRVS